MARTVRTATSLEWKPRTTQPPPAPTAIPRVELRPRPHGHEALERKSIFHQIPSDCLVHYLDCNNHKIWEREYATPALEKLGYIVKYWSTVDVDPLTRSVAVEKEGVISYFYCLPKSS